MARNNGLGAAKKDEFYTQLTDIEKEMHHYRSHFKGKTVLCNCDDPFESNFFKYFVLNFNRLGLKKLVATCYFSSPICGETFEFEQVQADHIIPWSKGGRTVPDNCQMLCRDCNLIKGQGSSRGLGVPQPLPLRCRLGLRRCRGHHSSLCKFTGNSGISLFFPVFCTISRMRRLSQKKHSHCHSKIYRMERMGILPAYNPSKISPQIKRDGGRRYSQGIAQVSGQLPLI